MLLKHMHTFALQHGLNLTELLIRDWYTDNPGNRDESQLIILPDLLDPDPLD